MENNNKNIDFLQSAQWMKFQEAVGRKTHHIESDGSASPTDKFSASVVEHILPIVGKYFYVPRGPVFSAAAEKISNDQFPMTNEFSSSNDQIKNGMQELIDLAKKENAGWIRIDPGNNESLELIKENIAEKIVKAPHDMQPKEVFIIDIKKSTEQLLAEMKPKTRYNIGMAQKKGVKIYSCDKNEMECMRTELEFFRLTKEMAARQGIVSHPEAYYRKMIESLPSDMLKIYAAEYDGKIIATNLVLFHPHTKKDAGADLHLDNKDNEVINKCSDKNISVGVHGDTAIYLHGASGNLHRNLMAPFSLQWQAILDAKDRGCTKYDFGGVKTQDTRYKIQDTNKWEGITTFKTGFSPHTKPLEFPGSYDIIINPRMYAVYRGLQRAKAFAVRFRK